MGEKRPFLEAHNRKVLAHGSTKNIINFYHTNTKPPSYSTYAQLVSQLEVKKIYSEPKDSQLDFIENLDLAKPSKKNPKVSFRADANDFRTSTRN